jgi:hypothetical protein
MNNITDNKSLRDYNECMARFEKEKQRMRDISSESWEQIAGELTNKQGYKPNLIPQNFPIVLEQLGINISDIDDATMNEFLDWSKFEGDAADKLAALVRGDAFWFRELQKRS